MSANSRVTLNLPVKDLKASIEFFRSLGIAFDPHHTGDEGACLVIGENIHARLVPESRFRRSTPNAVCDAQRFSEVTIGISAPTRERVDEIVRAAVRGGGMIFRGPDDHGTKYTHGFQDLDGHVWEVMTTEPAPTPSPGT